LIGTQAAHRFRADPNDSVGGEMPLTQAAVHLRIAVEGEFNGDVTSHSANLKLVLPLGGRVAPPPAEHMSAVHKPN